MANYTFSVKRQVPGQIAQVIASDITKAQAEKRIHIEAHTLAHRMTQPAEVIVTENGMTQVILKNVKISNIVLSFWAEDVPDEAPAKITPQLTTEEKLAKRIAKIASDDCGTKFTPACILAWMRGIDEDDLVGKSPRELANDFECG